MAQLRFFKDFSEKNKFFSNQKNQVINTKKEFDEWFEFYTQKENSTKLDFIFRGMGEAKHRLYTSSQRIWLQNDMNEWCSDKYINFIDRTVQEAKSHPLIKKAFDVYGYSDEEREFPILSILQHYGAYTPLMDWSYNINVALFFATDNVTVGNGTNSISDYFSIYRINKAKYRNEFLNLTDFNEKLPSPIKAFEDWSDNSKNPNKNGVFYISDMEDGNAYGNTPVRIRTSRPLTSIFNQNIIPQEGLFIFNPFSNKTLEEIFNVNLEQDGYNLELTPFSCFNIKKDLADYVRRRIKNHDKIDSPFIYPHLYNDAQAIKNRVLNSYAV
jgi:hypothetical protein